MRRIRAFWDRSLFHKVLLSLVGFVCVCSCLPGLLAGGRGAPAAGSAATPVRQSSALVETVAPTATAAPTATPAPTRTPRPTATPRGYVSRDMLGAAWPLTVEDGVVACEPPRLVTFTTGGVTYAVNGSARTVMEGRGWRDITEIWADDGSGLGLKIDISPLIERGLAAC